MFFKKCAWCKKRILMTSKEDEQGFYHDRCYVEKQMQDAREYEENMQRKAQKDEERAAKKAQQRKLADKQLLDDLEQERVLQHVQKKVQQKKQSEETPMQKPAPQKRQKISVQSEETVLFVEASVKHLTVTEYLEGKKRVLLNRKREIRRTHAGGFSAEKFQKFVDAQKRGTLDWIMKAIENDQLYRQPYEKIIIDAEPDIEHEIMKYFKEKGLV